MAAEEPRHVPDGVIDLRLRVVVVEVRSILGGASVPSSDSAVPSRIKIHEPDIASEITKHENDLIRRGDWRGTRKIRGHQQLS